MTTSLFFLSRESVLWARRWCGFAGCCCAASFAGGRPLLFGPSLPFAFCRSLPFALVLMLARASVLGYFGDCAKLSLVYMGTGRRAGAAAALLPRGAAAGLTACTMEWLVIGIGGFRRATTGRAVNATAGFARAGLAVAAT